jgi:RNA recognition motif-containing protein
MLQSGPVGMFKTLSSFYSSLYLIDLFYFIVNVHLPKDRISMAHQGYGFCEFLTEEDAEYACKIMNQIKLWGKPIRVNKVRRI